MTRLRGLFSTSGSESSMPMARLPRQLPMQRQSRRWRPSSDATIVLDIEGAGGGMKTKVTLRIDSDLLREARILAIEEGRSVSALPVRSPSMRSAPQCFSKSVPRTAGSVK